MIVNYNYFKHYKLEKVIFVTFLNEATTNQIYNNFNLSAFLNISIYICLNGVYNNPHHHYALKPFSFNKQIYKHYIWQRVSKF